MRRVEYRADLDEQFISSLSGTQKVIFALLVVFLIPLIAGVAYSVHANIFAAQNNEQTPSLAANKNLSSPALTSSKLNNILGEAAFNIPTTLNDKVTINGNLLVANAASFTQDVAIKDKNLTLGAGKITASNVVYGLTAGANIIISGDNQNPVISAVQQPIPPFPLSVLSVQGKQGDVTLTSGSGIGINGLEISNSDPGSAQDIFKTIAVGSDSFSAGSNTDTLSFVAGTGMTITADTENKQLTFSASVASDSGVLSLTGTANQVNVSGSTGQVTLSLPQDINMNSAPTFSSLHLSANTNQFVLGSGNTATMTMTPLSTSRTYTLPDASGTFCLTTGNCAGVGGSVQGSGTVGQIAFFNANNSITSEATGFTWDATNDKLGIGNDTPDGKFHVNGAVTGKALVILNQTGNQDILTASSSGNTRFILSNAGNIVAGTYNGNTLSPGSGTLTFAAGKTLTVNNTLTFAGTDGTTFTFPGTGTVVTTDATQTLTNKTIAAGSNTITGLTNANLSGSAGITNANLANSSLTVNTGTGLSGGSFVALGGAITLTNTGVTSAVAGSGISLSGGTGAVTITNAGVTSLSGTSNQVNVSAATGAVILSLPQDINQGATPTFASLNLSGNTNQLVLGTTITGTITMSPLGASRTYTLPDASGIICLSGQTCSSSGTLGYFTRNTTTLTPSTLSDRLLLTDGSTSDTSNFRFEVNGKQTGKALVAFNETGNQDIFTASASGTTRFIIGNDGTLTAAKYTAGVAHFNGSGVISSGLVANNELANNSITVSAGTGIGVSGSPVSLGGTVTINNNGVTLLNSGTGSLTLDNAGAAAGGHITINDASTGQKGIAQFNSTNFSAASGTVNTIQNINTAATPTFAGLLPNGTTGQFGWFQRNAGALAPANITDDLLLGATATTSAKFGILNIGSGVPTASLSAGLTGGTYLTAGGALQTTANQTLSLGGSTTGNIILNGDNNDQVAIGTATPPSWATLYVAGDVGTSSDFILSDGQSLDWGDASTYIAGSSITDAIQFITNASQKAAIDANGNFMINTTNPLATFDVHGNSGTTPIASFSGQTAQAGLIVDNSGLGDLFTASKSGATKFVITNAGNVGIGTNTPGALLDLVQNNHSIRFKPGAFNAGQTSSIETDMFGDELTFGTTQSGGTFNSNLLYLTNTGTIGIGLGSGAINSGLDIRNTTNTFNGGTISVASVSGATSKASFVVDQSGVGDLFTASKSGATKFVITNAGNVGIGTSAPSQTLSVQGTGSFSGNNSLLLLGQDPSASPYYSNVILKGVGSSQGASIALESTFVSTTQDWYFGSGTGAPSPNNNFRIVDLTHSATDRLNIDVNGNVGINTTTPTALLDVAGAASVSGSLNFRTGAGAIQTTANNTLTLGGTTTGDITFRPGGVTAGNSLYLASNGNVGIGTTSPVATLDLRGNSGTTAFVSISGQTSNAGLIVDNTGSGDLFTASKSGASKFTILNNGDIKLAGGINLGGTVGTSSQCLLGGATPTWGSCSTGSNFFNQASGLTYLGNTTSDFAIGGTSSSSAQFSVTGMNGGTGSLQKFATNGFSLPAVRNAHTSVTANGYVYVIGGSNTLGQQSTVYYAKLNADGSTGAWITNTNSLPANRTQASSVAANGYVYVIGGWDGTNSQTTVYYAKLNADGSVGSWLTNANALPTGRDAHTSVVANGYVYVIGGETTDSTVQTTVYYAKLNADGSTGVWQTNANTLPAARYNHSSVVANGYIYVIGGHDGTNSQTTVYYARVNADGSTGSWTTSSNALPAVRNSHSSVISNGYVYVIGGENTSGTSQSTVYYANLNTNGSTGAWSTNANSLPAIRDFQSSVVANGYVYVIGGYDGTNTQSTVYYSSTARLSFAGNIDLIGLAGGSLASASANGSFGSVGGSIFAGNIFSNGSLEIAGNTQLWNGLSVNGMQTLNGSLNIAGSLSNYAVASVSAQTNANAAFVLDNNGTGDLFTASKSGATKFTILNNGDIKLAGGINLGETVGNNTQCLLGGATASWGSCSSSNYWQLNSGAISPFSNTLDTLIGGTATSSAKFGFLNMASGTPNFLLGSGDGGTPTAAIIRGAAAAGSNVAGANLTLNASNGTGTGGSGDLIFQTATPTQPIHDADSTVATCALCGSLTWSHTTTTNSNRILVVGVTTIKATAAAPSGVTYAGSAMTQITNINESSSSNLSLWYIVAPATGANNVVVTAAGSTIIIGGSSSYYNVDQSTPVGTSATNTGSSFPASVTVNSTNNSQIVVDTLTLNTVSGGDQLFPGLGQSKTWSTDAEPNMGSYKPGSASSTTMTWTDTKSTAWGIIGVPINAVSSSTANTLTDRFHINATGDLALNGNTTIAANKNLVLSSGTGQFSQTYNGTDNAALITANSLINGSALLVQGNFGYANGLVTIRSTGNTGANGGSSLLNLDSGANAAGTIALNIGNSGGLGFSSDISLQNGATIDNATSNQINMNLGTNGTLKLTNGSNLTTDRTTFNLINTVATTLNIGGVATTLKLGAATGTTAINNSLTVGSGSTSPFATLDVRGNSGTTPVASVSGQTAKAAFFVDNSGVGDLFTASKSGATKFVITNAGNVGIGTTTPGGLLTLSGTSNDTALLGTAAGNTSNALINFAPSSDNIVRFGLRLDNSSKNLNIDYRDSVTGNPLTALTITRNGGNVGIGTANPGASLDIAGGTIQGAGLSSDCSGSNSKLLWSSSTKQFSCGTDRASVSVRKTSDQSVSNNTMTNDNELTFPISAGDTYIFHITMNQTNTGNTFRYQITAPATTTCNITSNGYDTTGFNTELHAAGCSSVGTYGGGGSASQNTIDGTVTTTGNGNVTLQFANGGSGTATVKAGSSLVAYKVNGADLAEAYYTKDATIQPGDVVQVDGSLKAGVKKTETAYDPHTLGIISTKPSIVLGDNTASDRPVLLALNGRVPVKVSSMNGPIEPGDYLTTSSIPGVAMKATYAGQMIGKAMENYTNNDPNAVGTILVFTNLSWADPSLVINDDGTLSADSLPVSLPLVNKNLQDLTATVSAIQTQTNTQASQLTALNDRVASVEAKIAHYDSVILSNSTIGLSYDQINFDPLAFNDRIATSSSFTDISSKFDSVNKRLSFLELQASGSALLGNASGSIIASSSGQLNLDQMDMTDATFSGTLNVLGRTVLSDVGITGRVNIGLLAIDGINDDGFASLNTTSGPLKLQSDGLNGIDILAGKVIIDPKGNIKTEGAITATTVTTSKLNVTTDSSTVLSSSTGSVVIRAGQTSIDVTTTALTAKSLIFATPDQPTGIGAKAKDKDTFTITLQAPAEENIKVNWWLIN